MKKKTDEEMADAVNNASSTRIANCIIAKAASSANIESSAKQAIKKALYQPPEHKERTDRNKYITPELMAYIRSYFNTTNSKGKKWIYDYIDTVLQKAKKDPESKSGMLLTNMIFNKEDFLGHLDALLDDKDKNDIEFNEYKIRKTLYDKQQEVFDNSINNKFLIINSRRSGKTELLGRLAVRDLMKPNHRVVYINRNSSAAIRQISKPFETALNAQSLIHIVKGSVAGQEVDFDNGSKMLIIGNNNSADIDKMRGEKISLIIIDECGHQRNMRQMIREVIRPAMMDFGPEAKMVLVGTPPRNRGTYIEECYNNAIERGWKIYKWTFMDNPFIPDRNKVIEEVCKENGCSPDSAFIRREYYGEMGAYDEDAKWIKHYSFTEKLPNTFDYAWVGVDWGYEDKAAVVSCVADKSTHQMYIVDSWTEAKKGIKEISDEIKRQYNNLTENYNIARRPLVICDTNEKGAVSDLYHVYQIKDVATAYKYDKDMALDQLNDFFSSNKIVLKKGAHLDGVIEDLDNTLWKRDEETDKITHEIDDDAWHPNCGMAILYVSRQYAIDVLNLFDVNKAVKDIVSSVF